MEAKSRNALVSLVVALPLVAGCSVSRMYVTEVKKAAPATFAGTCQLRFDELDTTAAAPTNEMPSEESVGIARANFTRSVGEHAHLGDPQASRHVTVRTRMTGWDPGLWATNFDARNATGSARVEIVDERGDVLESFDVRTDVNANVACADEACRAKGLGFGLGFQVAHEVDSRVGCAREGT